MDSLMKEIAWNDYVRRRLSIGSKWKFLVSVWRIACSIIWVSIDDSRDNSPKLSFSEQMLNENKLTAQTRMMSSRSQSITWIEPPHRVASINFTQFEVIDYLFLNYSISLWRDLIKIDEILISLTHSHFGQPSPKRMRSIEKGEKSIDAIQTSKHNQTTRWPSIEIAKQTLFLWKPLKMFRWIIGLVEAK